MVYPQVENSITGTDTSDVFSSLFNCPKNCDSKSEEFPSYQKLVHFLLLKHKDVPYSFYEVLETCFQTLWKRILSKWLLSNQTQRMPITKSHNSTWKYWSVKARISVSRSRIIGSGLEWPRLWRIMYLSLFVHKWGQQTMKAAIKTFLASLSF